ncbi:HD-GYP domain-containing protein [Aneurinibacillus tyrosinisolvens]|uniref:HD-GYP domain-containing protein n=1 Tax=Aneurinibacillus tyrosinisolvens TaxID=1443435 RepID=UPI00063F83F0|nr:HD-GYP domain-containing protein [Aneurinibacillus tyrosinisolvens]
MPQLLTDLVKPGVTLSEQVVTSLGGVLFEKGTRIQQREIEILKAFLIERISIEEEVEDHAVSVIDKGKAEQVKIQKAEEPDKRFDLKVSKAADYLEKITNWVGGGMPIPVMDLRETVQPLVQAVNAKPDVLFSIQKIKELDKYTYEHSIFVGILSVAIARWMKIPEQEYMQISLAGTLHNIGVCRIEPSILHKPGKLNYDEFEEVKKHTSYGYQIIKGTAGLSEGVALAALQHHEREDGSGYPQRVKGNQIHLYAKIVAIADVYHAMCTERGYRKALSPYRVIEQLREYSFGKLDPVIVRTFISGIMQLSAGKIVRLNDGRVGKIIFVDPQNPTRPMIDINGQIVNLVTSPSSFIEDVISV